MKNRTKKISGGLGTIIVLVAMAVMPSLAYANAFFIQENSGDVMAQGGAVAAGGSTPASMFQNAANLSFIEDLHFQVNATVYIPKGSFKSKETGETTEVQTGPQTVPAFFASWKINDWLAVGIAEFTAFGLSIDWPKNWEGKEIVTEAGINTFTINPNISFGPFHGFAVAAGFDALWGEISIKRDLQLGMDPLGEKGASSNVHLFGRAWGFGGNIGVMYQPAEWVRMGMHYRSAMKISLEEGKADFNPNSAFASWFPDQKFKADITLPHLFVAGARFWPTENIGIELDVWGTFWSTYDKLKFKFDKGLGDNNNEKVQEEDKNYMDTYQLRIGAEWKFLDHYALRGGWMIDANPIPDDTLDPMLPDNNRINTCIGFGTEWYGFYADLAYMFVYLIPRDVSNVDNNPIPGKYTAYTHVLTFSVGYHFDPFATYDEEEADGGVRF